MTFWCQELTKPDKVGSKGTHFKGIHFHGFDHIMFLDISALKQGRCLFVQAIVSPG